MTVLQRQARQILDTYMKPDTPRSPWGYRISHKQDKILEARQQEIYGPGRDFHGWLYDSGYPRPHDAEWQELQRALLYASRERLNAMATPKGMLARMGVIAGVLGAALTILFILIGFISSI